MNTQDIETVVTGILNYAAAERRKSEPWKALFGASEQGLRPMLSEAEHKMSGIVLDMVDVIKQRFGIQRPSKKLIDLLKALPFAMWEVREGIDSEEGLCCCADKAREAYYREVLEEINRIKSE